MSSEACILDEYDQKLINDFWPKVEKNHKDFFTASWLAALEASPQIRGVFGFGARDEPLENQRFSKTVKSAKDFFDLLIQEHKFELQKCRSSCETLGARHVNYAQRGFKPFYWDIFTACLVYCFEEEVKEEKIDTDTETELVKAWRKLVQKVVEMMRDGYRLEMHRVFVAEKLEERDRLMHNKPMK